MAEHKSEERTLGQKNVPGGFDPKLAKFLLLKNKLPIWPHFPPSPYPLQSSICTAIKFFVVGSLACRSGCDRSFLGQQIAPKDMQFATFANSQRKCANG